MANKDMKQWINESVELNQNIALKVGMEVEDFWGHKGIVVKIEVWGDELTVENHGTVYVWQSERFNYGDDNCEHYCFFGWEKSLRLTEYKSDSSNIKYLTPEERLEIAKSMYSGGYDIN